ncbi:MAG: SIS domain-containing protein [Alphaproteobacteria bacterium]|nr:SIS domain-containing protein [Alphaproteobacteria bacterium]
MTHALITRAVAEHQKVTAEFFAAQSDALAALAALVTARLAQGNKLLLCGNGGSACDALHIAAEFVGRFVKERAALPAIALTADVAALTAIGNDYGYDRVFARQVEAHGNKGDILIAMSTSGSSPNVLNAISAATARGVTTVLLTGAKAKGKEDIADHVFIVPSTNTARIQEVHITALHLLAEMVDAGF